MCILQNKHQAALKSILSENAVKGNAFANVFSCNKYFSVQFFLNVVDNVTT